MLSSFDSSTEHMICIHCAWTALLPPVVLHEKSHRNLFRSGVRCVSFPSLIPLRTALAIIRPEGWILVRCCEANFVCVNELIAALGVSGIYWHISMYFWGQLTKSKCQTFFWDLEWWVLEGSIVTGISLNQFWRQDFAVQAGNLKRKDIQITLTETVLLWTLASKTKQKTKPYEKTNQYSEWNGRNCRLAGSVPTPGLHFTPGNTKIWIK